MKRILNANREELRVVALPQELDLAARLDIEQLQTLTASIELQAVRRGDGVEAEVTIRNLAGHKIPTAYPSRRMWLRFAVRD